MKLKQSVVIAVTVVGVLAVSVQPWASAAPAPAGDITATIPAFSAAVAAQRVVVTPARQHPGGWVQVQATGFAPDARARVTIAGRSTPVRTTTTGSVDARVRVPWQAPPGTGRVRVLQGNLGGGAPLWVHTDWPMAGGNLAHTNANPWEKQLTKDTADELELRWHTNLTDRSIVDGSNVARTMSIYGDSGYVCSANGGINKVDLRDGRVVWHGDAKIDPRDRIFPCSQGGAYRDERGFVWFGDAGADDEVGPPPCCFGVPSDVAIPYKNLVISGGTFGAVAQVRARDAVTHQQVWAAIPGGAGTIMIGTRLFTASDKFVHELDPDTGEEVNRFYPTVGSRYSSTLDMVSDGKNLYLLGQRDIDPDTGAGQRTWSAFDPDGTVLWDVPAEGYEGGHPTVADGIMVFPADAEDLNGTVLKARSTTDGRLLWTTPLSIGAIAGNRGFFAVAGGLVYVPDPQQGRLLVFDATTGRVVTTYRNFPDTTSTIVVNGHLYALTITGLYDYALPTVR